MSLESIRKSLKKAIEMMDSISAYYNKPKPTKHYAHNSFQMVAEISCFGDEYHGGKVVIDEGEQIPVVGSINLGSNIENTENLQTCQVDSNEDECYVLGADIGLYLDDISTCLEEFEPCIDVESSPMLKEAMTQTLELSLPTNTTCEVMKKYKQDMVLKSDVFSAFRVPFDVCSNNVVHTFSYEEPTEVIREFMDTKWMSFNEVLRIEVSSTFGFIANQENSEIFYGFDGEALVMTSYVVWVFDPGG